jgi:hypothetical protein
VKPTKENRIKKDDKKKKPIKMRDLQTSKNPKAGGGAPPAPKGPVGPGG